MGAVGDEGGGGGQSARNDSVYKKQCLKGKVTRSRNSWRPLSQYICQLTSSAPWLMQTRPSHFARRCMCVTGTRADTRVRSTLVAHNVMLLFPL